jgi:hypothetical protein
LIAVTFKCVRPCSEALVGPWTSLLQIHILFLFCFTIDLGLLAVVIDCCHNQVYAPCSEALVGPLTSLLRFRGALRALDFPPSDKYYFYFVLGLGLVAVVIAVTFKCVRPCSEALVGPWTSLLQINSLFFLLQVCAWWR